MKTLPDSELAQVIEALGGACEEISKMVVNEGGYGDEFHRDTPEPTAESDHAFADTLRAFEACDKAYELLTGHFYDMTPDGEGRSASGKTCRPLVKRLQFSWHRNGKRVANG
jgi:hypothetical protein